MAQRYYARAYASLAIGGYFVYDRTTHKAVPGHFHNTLEAAQDDAKQLNQQEGVKRQEQEAQ